jgi:hypothetical protein
MPPKITTHVVADKASHLFECRRPAVTAWALSGRIPTGFAVRKFISRLFMPRAQERDLIAASPDRLVLRAALLPEVAKIGGDILFVGVEDYTVEYPSLLEANGGTCWTIDYNPNLAKYGCPNRHVVGSVTELEQHYPDTLFSTIVLNGVFGFGLYGYKNQMAALASCAAVLAEDGLFILGWNEGRTHPQVLEDLTKDWFDYAPLGELPARLWVNNTDHTFALLRKKSART